ncbi:MAG: hypothetical protein C4533_02400 [Candidatus Omnitrophota bacterium]|jgi:hypothetical protein|nr:MAG: hypothetical protein C4533_02400 [Candidatus Omnitrophota bacterium]
MVIDLNKNKFKKGGVKMRKTIGILLILAIAIVLPQLAYADISLTASATVTSGTALGAHALLRCVGYSYNPSGDPFAQCTSLGTSTSLNFGTLSTRLRNSSGQDIGGAGCFYGENFYIVYLYPDAWGGKGYELKQSAATFSPAIQNSVVRTPVYSESDMYSGQTTGQGALTATEESNNPQLTPSVSALAKNAGLILKAKRARIIRAEYGIPPFPGTGDSRPTGWEAVSLETAAGTYSGTVTLTMTEWL